MTPEKFWSLIDQSAGPNACWPWLGHLLSDGYGGFTNGKRPKRTTVRAHRHAMALTLGRPITASEVVCHRCDNPPCVNPAHLFVGTQADNVRDMWNKGRGRYMTHRGEAHYKARLTEQNVRDIRARMDLGAVDFDLANEYGVTVSHIRNIAYRRAWKHLA